MTRGRDAGLLATLVGDGRPLLSLSGVLLVLSGTFAIFLAARREFLPHDIAFLGMTADELCRRSDCRIVGFMFHDRVAFGGTLVAVGVLYLWLAAAPMRDGQVWAWRTFAASGVAGFSSFLAYLGYGYLDTWHGAATLGLLPCFIAGLALSRPAMQRRDPAWLLHGGRTAPSALRAGRWLLVATAAGIVLAGGTILFFGMTRVFVPTDLEFMRLTADDLRAINPRLVPLIAHDRAGFGGGLVSTGLLIAGCAWYAPTSRAFRQTIAVAGLAGFGCGIGVHFVEGYTDTMHLAPAFAGAALFVAASALEAIGAREMPAPDGVVPV